MKLFVGVEKDNESNVYAAYSDSLEKAQEKIIDQFVEDEIKNDNFLEYVKDESINFSVNEKFWKLDGEYIYTHSSPYYDSEYIAEVHEQCPPNKSIVDFVWDLFCANVLDFFEGNELYANMFIHDQYTDDLLRFMCKKLVVTGDWTTFIVKQVNPV